MITGINSRIVFSFHNYLEITKDKNQHMARITLNVLLLSSVGQGTKKAEHRDGTDLFLFRLSFY
jgi:hypothetical protein